MTSPAQAYAEALVRKHGKAGAHRAIDELLERLSVVELAALAAHWPLWARPKQTPPETCWRSFGLLTGRGFGKTRALSEFVNLEVMTGRIRLIGLCAQNEDNAIAIQVTGPSGLIARAHPKFRPVFEASVRQLVWPNGARAYVRTPEVPGNIRGVDYELAWLTEIQSWPASTRDEAFSNFMLTTRLGYARTVWDATPKKRHPILRALLARSDSEPDRHLISRGTTFENPMLAPGVSDDMRAELGGTQRGREELLGEMLADSESALVRQEWIDDRRRYMPERLMRRVIGIDPAITARKGSDRTGIVDVGLGPDDQVHVLGDYSGKHDPPTWAGIVLDKYVQNGCDLVVVETNKGGELVTQNLRAHAGKRGLAVNVVDKGARPHRVAGTVFVKEVFARGQKEDRSQPLATAYERGRISHVRGADLASLEDTLTTWEPAPGARSPDDLDALTHAVVELLGLSENRVDARAGFAGITELARTLAAPVAPGNLAALLGGGGTGGRI